MIANGNVGKKDIFSLDHDNRKIFGQANLKAYITQFYKDLFGAPEENSFALDESRKDDIFQVTQVENDSLAAPFTEKEVWDAIFDMKHNKAPGPDGFPVEFCQKFWDVIKSDLMQMFHELYAGTLPLLTSTLES